MHPCLLCIDDPEKRRVVKNISTQMYTSGVHRFDFESKE